MKKTIYLFTILYIFFSCNTKNKSVEIELVSEIRFKDELKDYPCLLIGDEIILEETFDHHKFKSKIYSKIKEENFDFGQNDYIFSFGKKISKLEYGTRLSKKHDFCDYLSKVPVFPVYHEKENKIFIYKIKEKDKYRHQCL